MTLNDVDAEAEHSLVQYNGFDKEEFRDLVNRSYADGQLMKWIPAPIMPSDPDSPGNLGILLIYYVQLKTFLTDQNFLISMIDCRCTGDRAAGKRRRG